MSIDTEKSAAELIAPTLKNRLFVAINCGAASGKSVKPFVAEHIAYMAALAVRLPAHLWVAYGMAGVDLMTLRELMGHSSITTTQRYCHPTPEHQREAVEKLRKFNQAHFSASRAVASEKVLRFMKGVPTKVPTVAVEAGRQRTSKGAVSY